MSVIIKGMGLPKECDDCFFCLTHIRGRDRVPVCIAASAEPVGTKYGGRPSICPLEELNNKEE